MAKLPFVVEPRLKPIIERIGNEDIGVIEIERRGYLTAAEKAFVQAQVGADDASREMMSLVRSVGSKYKVDFDTAYTLVQNAMQGIYEKKRDIVADFPEKIDNLIEVLQGSQTRRTVATAYCMLIYRVDSTIKLDDMLESDIEIINGLAKLFNEEEARSVERLKESDEKIETGGDNPAVDIEKKQ